AMIGKFLNSWMQSETGVTNLIGTGDSIRFWPARAPQKQETFPRVLYMVTSNTPVKTLTKGSSGVRVAKVTMDVQALDPGGYAEAKQLAEAIAGVPDNPKLNGWRGTAGGIYVQSAQMDD